MSFLTNLGCHQTFLKDLRCAANKKGWKTLLQTLAKFLTNWIKILFRFGIFSFLDVVPLKFRRLLFWFIIEVILAHIKNLFSFLQFMSRTLNCSLRKVEERNRTITRHNFFYKHPQKVTNAIFFVGLQFYHKWQLYLFLLKCKHGTQNTYL